MLASLSVVLVALLNLEKSPLFSASMVELTQPPRRANAGASDLLSSGGGEDEEAPGGIANMRVVNASKVGKYELYGS